MSSKTVSGHHVLPDTSEDFQLILRVLQTEQVFIPVPCQAHSTFKSIDANPFMRTKGNLKELHKWLHHHRRNAAIEQALMQNKF